MAQVHSSEVYSSITSLILAILSTILCSIVVLSIQMHPKSKDSYHLRIVYNLLMADLLMSIAVIFYYIIQFPISSRQLNAFCHFYLPLVVYFFLMSYIWTIMFALRFRTMKKPDNLNKIVTWKPPIKFGRLWIYPLIYIFPLFILAYTLPSVTYVWVNSSDTDQSCTFDHGNTDGIVLDFIYFQGPLLLTICINVYSYTKGLIALKNSPHSVLGRQMRKAGGYLSVLLIVWVPNIIYNFLSIFSGSDDYTSFLNLCVVLSSSQGILNVCVYVYSDPGLRRFIRKNIFFLTYFGKKKGIGGCGGGGGGGSNGRRKSSDRDNNGNGIRTSGMLKNSLSSSSQVSRPSSKRRGTDDSLESESMNGSEDGIDIRISRLSDLTASRQSANAIGTTVNNPMTNGSISNGSSTVTGEKRSSIGTTITSGGLEHRKSVESGENGPKSILVPKSRFSLKQNDFSTSIGDLDQEKFVRFGA
jgi:hypothetical protein